MSDEFWTMFNNASNTLQTNSNQIKELGKREKEIIYRERLGNAFKELTSLIPELKNQKCISRLMILERAVYRINQLQGNELTLTQEKQLLIKENINLKRMVHTYSNPTKTFPSPTSSFTL